MLLCSKLLKYNGPSGDQEKDLLHDIIAYYVELGNPWPPYQNTEIPSRIGQIPMENLLTDLFRQVYMVREGYQNVCRNHSWLQVKQALAIPNSLSSAPEWLERIYRFILLPYERERRRLEANESKQLKDITDPYDLIGWTLKLQLIFNGLDGNSVQWLWGTVVGYQSLLEKHVILLDNGIWISVNLDDVFVELGTLDDSLRSALKNRFMRNKLSPNHPSTNSSFSSLLPVSSCQNHAVKAPSCNTRSSLAWMGNEVFTGVSSPIEEHLLIEYDLSPQVYYFEKGRKLSILARSWTEPSRKSDTKDQPISISKYNMLIIRCICGCNIDNGDLVACSICRVWFHKVCVGWEPISNAGHPFRCFLCDPSSQVSSQWMQMISQAIEKVRSQPKWSDIKERIQQGDFWDHQEAPFSSSSSSSSTVKGASKQSKDQDNAFSSSIRAWKSSKRLKSNVRESTKTINKRPRIQAPEFVRCPQEEAQFYISFRSFWNARGRPIDKLPMFRGKPFDFYALFVGVRDRGGEQAVIDNKQWPEIWKIMNNYYKESTDHSYQLRRYYEIYLKAYADSILEKDMISSTNDIQEAAVPTTKDTNVLDKQDGNYPKVKIVYSKSNQVSE
eukprot:jgi/Galph1/3499/GphlegSOOS_G2122.1